jgi:hypothetical protein
MCLNCGCGEPDARHQPTDITRDDLKRAADGSGISMDEATRNVRTAIETLGGSEQSSAGGAAPSA